MSIVCIGGWDPSGLAGLSVDERAASALGVHAHGVVAALTAQHEAGSYVLAENVASQLEAAAAWSPACVKIGMLGGERTIAILHRWLAQPRGFTVLDPVLESTGGVPLFPAAELPALRRFLGEVDLVTPNLREAEQLCNLERGAIVDASGMERAAIQLLGLGARAVLLKGGHRAGSIAQDLFATPTARVWVNAPRGEDARGTGCALATAIAAAMSWGAPRVYDLLDAIVVGKAQVLRGLRGAEPIGAARRLGHAPWPPDADDVPWITESADEARPRFSALEAPGFYPIVGRAAEVLRLAEVGVRTVQLRIKHAPLGALRAELGRAIAGTRGTRCRLFVNDHLELAIELGAFGVHLGQEDLLRAGPARIAALAAAGLRLGLSTHSYAELARARALRPSYVALGPIYATTLKAMRFAPQTPERLTEWRRLCDAPLVAIGGITLARVPELTVADGVSVVADLQVGSLEARARAFLRLLPLAGPLAHRQS